MIELCDPHEIIRQPSTAPLGTHCVLHWRQMRQPNSWHGRQDGVRKAPFPWQLHCGQQLASSMTFSLSIPSHCL